MSDPGTTGGPQSNVSALIDALDERARQAGSEGATAVLRGILGSVAEVLNGIETRLGQIEERTRYEGGDGSAGALAEQVQNALVAFNSRLGRLEEAFVKAVEDSGSGTDTVIEQVRSVVEEAIRDRPPDAAPLGAAISGDVTEVIADMRDRIDEVAAQIGEVGMVRAEVRAVGARLDELADVRNDLADLAQLVEAAQRYGSQRDALGDEQSAQVSDDRARMDQLAAELLAQVANMRDRLADVAATVDDVAAIARASSAPDGGGEPTPARGGPDLAGAVGEMVTELRDLALAVDDLREEVLEQEDARADAGGSSTLQATGMLTSQVADLAGSIRAQNEVIAELRSLAGSLRDSSPAAVAAEATAGLQASMDALRADVTAALHRTETTLVQTLAAPPPRRRLLPVLALLVALAAIGFSLLPFTGNAGGACDPPVLVANPDIRETAGYEAPPAECRAVGNTRLIGAAAVAFLAVVVGTYGVAVPPRPKGPNPARGR